MEDDYFRQTMADFLTNLWGSVFTPGATPTLLVATNATFAALQALLLALLIATYSIHFAILSVLCGGLWYSINWFATELRAAQAKEAEAERLRKVQSSPVKDLENWRTKGIVADSEADDEDEDTETETEHGMKDSITSASADEDVRERARRAAEELAAKATAVTAGTEAAGRTSGMEQAVGGAARQRDVSTGDRSGYVSSSTDSEWEKVDDGR